MRTIRVTFVAATQAQRDIALARSALVNGVLTASEYETEYQAIKRICKDERGPDGEALTESKLRRWVKDFRTHQLDGLVPQYRSDAGVRRVLANVEPGKELEPGDVERVIRAVVCGKGGAAVVRRLLKNRYPHVTWAPKTIERWVREFKAQNPHLVYFATEGEGQFISKFKIHLGWSLVRPLELMMLDSTQLDLEIQVKEVTGRVGTLRPWVALMMDVGTRAVITFVVTLSRPTPATMLTLLRRAWCVGENWTGLPWVPLPSRLKVDAGSEHRGEFAEALQALGLHERLVPGPPEKQSFIERTIQSVLTTSAVWGQLGHTAVDRTAGATDTSTREHARGKRAANREACKRERPHEDLLTLDELLELLTTTCVDHNNRLHRGLEQDAYNRRAASYAQ